jgi:hypothetical protein
VPRVTDVYARFFGVLVWPFLDDGDHREHDLRAQIVTFEKGFSTRQGQDKTTGLDSPALKPCLPCVSGPVGTRESC